MFTNTSHLYDLIYELDGKDYQREVAQVLAQVYSQVPNARTLLDVGCGTATHLGMLQKHFQVEGVDLDEGMLAIAKENYPNLCLTLGDMRVFNLGRRFDVVCCLFSSIGYLDDVGQLNETVNNLVTHLKPGGVLIVDGWCTPQQWGKDRSHSVTSGQIEDVSLARVSFNQRDGRKTRLEMHHLVADDTGIAHLVDVHELTLFTQEEYQTAFIQAGVSFELVDSPMSGRGRYLGLLPK